MYRTKYYQAHSKALLAAHNTHKPKTQYSSTNVHVGYATVSAVLAAMAFKHALNKPSNKKGKSASVEHCSPTPPSIALNSKLIPKLPPNSATEAQVIRLKNAGMEGSDPFLRETAPRNLNIIPEGAKSQLKKLIQDIYEASNCNTTVRILDLVPLHDSKQIANELEEIGFNVLKNLISTGQRSNDCGYVAAYAASKLLKARGGVQSKWIDADVELDFLRSNKLSEEGRAILNARGEGHHEVNPGTYINDDDVYYLLGYYLPNAHGLQEWGGSAYHLNAFFSGGESTDVLIEYLTKLSTSLKVNQDTPEYMVYILNLYNVSWDNFNSEHIERLTANMATNTPGDHWITFAVGIDRRRGQGQK